MTETQIEKILPGVIQRSLATSPILQSILSVMLSMRNPIERELNTIEKNFDPLQCPEASLPFLSSWAGLERIFDPRSLEALNKNEYQQPIASGSGHLRELLRSTKELSQWRGTNKGLVIFLEMATGIKGYSIQENILDENGQIMSFHFNLSIPLEAQPLLDLIKRITESEKPAYVTYEITLIETHAR